jgi:hypothetical protein
LLAKNVNDDEGCLDKRGAWASIASKLAPTRALLRHSAAAEKAEDAYCGKPTGLFRMVF